VRIAAGGIRYFFSDDWGWHLFDCFLVALSIVDLVMMTITMDRKSSVGSVMKMIKMLRIVRIFRVFRFFRELSMLALMIADSMKSLVWALFMLAIIIYVFSIVFTQACSNYVVTHPDENTPLMSRIHVQFGTLPKTVYHLVASMLGGESWGDFSETLWLVDRLSASLFLFI